eukprot:13869265-Ditylum_brightwellii.AAC.1
MKPRDVPIKLPINSDPIFFNQLLQDIEGSSISYKEFTLKRSASINLYGSKGSSEHRSFIDIANQLKRRESSSYKKILDYYNVTPDNSFLNLLSTWVENQTKTLFFDDDEKEQHKLDSNSDKEDKDSEDVFPMRKYCANPKKNLFKSPPYKKMFGSPLPAPISDFHSVASGISSHNILQDYGVSNRKSFILQDGTKSNPNVTFVNSEFPERNGGM